MLCVWLGEMHRLYSEAPVVNMKTPEKPDSYGGNGFSGACIFSYTLRGCRCVVSDLNERPYACAYAVYFFKLGSCEFRAADCADAVHELFFAAAAYYYRCHTGVAEHPCESHFGKSLSALSGHIVEHAKLFNHL